MTSFSRLVTGIGLTSLVFAGCTKVSTPAVTPVVEDTMKKTTEVMQKETEKDEVMMKKSDAKQISFTSEADAQALVANGPVVYFFKASWCPTCQALQKELDSSIGSLPSGTTIITVDYDNSSALKTKYAITYQHTLVQIDATGKEIAKWQGGGVSEIIKNIK